MGQQRSQLQSDHGTTSISDAVVAKISGVAAQEIEKVQMGGGAAASVGSFLGNVTGSSGPSLTRGVSVQVGQEEAAVDLTLAVEYGTPIPQTAEAVRRNVINRVENLVGLKVTEVNITVTDVPVPEERPMLGRQEEVKEQAQQA